MSKRPKVDFQALIQNDVAPSVAAVAHATVPVPGIPPVLAPDQRDSFPGTPVGKKPTLKQRTRQQSLYLEIPVHDTLREIAFVERKSLHALVLEGIDAVLKKRGSPSIRELVDAKSKSVL